MVDKFLSGGSCIMILLIEASHCLKKQLFTYQRVKDIEKNK